MDDVQPGANGAVSRRSAIKRTAGIAGAGLALSPIPLLEQVAAKPVRALADTTSRSSQPAFSDIQFDIGAFINAAQTFNDGAGNVTAQFAPVFSLFQPLTLSRTPSVADQKVFANALDTIEDVFPASPSGALIVSVSYGLPYFNRLDQKTVKANIPTDLASGQPALIEAVPFDTDVVGGFVGGPDALIQGVKKVRFNVNVVIEKNDVLLHTRSNNLGNLTNINAWLQGSNTLNGQVILSPAFKGLFKFQTARVQFLQQGMPQKVAEANNFEFAGRMNPDSAMAMGFVDQQTDSSGPPAITTFAGNSSAVMTSAKAGDYFDNGAIAHFSHLIQDLFAFFATPEQESEAVGGGEPFTERVQYMFRSNQLGTTDGIPADGNSDQFTNGGGPAFINNVFQGTGAALAGAQDSAGQFTAEQRHPQRHLHRPAPDRPRGGPAGVLPGHRRHPAAHPDGRPRLRQPGRPGVQHLRHPQRRQRRHVRPGAARHERAGRQQPVQAGVRDLRAHRPAVRQHAQCGSCPEGSGRVQRRRRRQRPGALHHRHPAPELPGSAAPAPLLPARRTRLACLPAGSERACPRAAQQAGRRLAAARRPLSRSAPKSGDERGGLE